jgi:hypothetical protein
MATSISASVMYVALVGTYVAASLARIQSIMMSGGPMSSMMAAKKRMSG